MSIKSFISKLWNNIRSIFNAFPKELQAAVSVGVVITENIKRFVDSPLADVLTNIIPGNLDDRIKQALRNGLPAILNNLKLTKNCEDLNNPQELTACAIKVLQNMDAGIKSIYLHNVSVLIAQLAADGKLSWSDGVCIVEWYYQNKYKQGNL